MDYTYDDWTAERLALGLGWFSIALGLAEVLAPRQLARFIGAPQSDASISTLRAFGAREIGAGVAILAQPDRAHWMWTRVGGDVLDLAALARASQSEEGSAQRTAMAAAAVLGVTALDVMVAQSLSQREMPGGASRDRYTRVHVHRSVTLNRSIEEVYAYWRQFENLPRFMSHLDSVEPRENGRWHWRAKAPAGMRAEWDAEIIEERENEVIAWRSVEGSEIHNAGRVRFERAPGARGTEVHVELDYQPPLGTAGRAIAWLFGESPDQQVKDELRRFKQIMETGEIPASDGPGVWTPAQPPAKSSVGLPTGAQR